MLRLDVFVSAHCFGCPDARRLAAAVAERFETVSVRVVDLDDAPEAKPERVIAVPAYLLDDEVISFGNPRQADLFRQVERALSAQQGDH
jgi:hypothetical protein